MDPAISLQKTLPAKFRSSYAQYKNDGNTIATWLSNTAIECGYPADLLGFDPDNVKIVNVVKEPSKGKENAYKSVLDEGTEKNKTTKAPRLKGKNRTLARQAANEIQIKAQKIEADKSDVKEEDKRNSIEIRDFIPLAQFIVSYDNPPVNISPSFLKLIDRVITLRKQHAQWFENAQGKDEDSVRSHRHFITILESVFDILHQRCEVVVKHSETKKTVDKEDLTNIFESLTVEEPSEGFINYQPPIRSDIIQPTLPIKQVKYEIRLDHDPVEKDLAIHCLFNDVADLREKCKHLWNEYLEYKTELRATSLALNFSVEMVRDAQREFEKVWGVDQDYGALSNQVLQGFCRNKGIDLNSIDFSHDVDNVACNEKERLMIDTFEIATEVRNASAAGNDIDISLELAHAEIMRKDLRNFSDTNKGTLILELISSSADIADAQLDSWVDEMVQMSREFDQGMPLKLWHTYALQIQIDLHSTPGIVIDMPFNELLTTARMTKQSLQHAMVHYKHVPSKYLEPLGSMIEFIDSNYLHSCVAQDSQDDIPLLCSSHSFLLRINPIYAGIQLAFLLFRYRCCNLPFVKSTGFIKQCAHLYNALEQEDMLAHRWIDLELLLASQSDCNVYVGEKPKRPEQYVTRNMLANGYLVVNKRNKSGTQHLLRGKGSVKHARHFDDRNSPLTNMLSTQFWNRVKRDGYLATNMKLILNDHAVITKHAVFLQENLVKIRAILIEKLENADLQWLQTFETIRKEMIPKDEILTNRVERVCKSRLGHLPGSQPASAAMSEISPGTLLSKFHAHLELETIAYHIDYLKVHDQAYRTLKSVQRMVEKSLLIRYPNVSTYDDLGLGGMVIDILYFMDPDAASVFAALKIDPKPTIKLVAQSFDRFLPQHNSMFIEINSHSSSWSPYAKCSEIWT